MENLNPVVPVLPAEPATEPVKNFRIVSTMFLDWPQHNFVLHAAESGIRNDFESPDSIPPEVGKKLVGFIRSGHLRFFDLRPMHDGGVPREMTPTVEELDDEGHAPDSEEEPFAPSLSADPPLGGRPNPNAPIPQNLGSDVTNSGTPRKDGPEGEPARREEHGGVDASDKPAL